MEFIYKRYDIEHSFYLDLDSRFIHNIEGVNYLDLDNATSKEKYEILKNIYIELRKEFLMLENTIPLSLINRYQEFKNSQESTIKYLGTIENVEFNATTSKKNKEERMIRIYTKASNLYNQLIIITISFLNELQKEIENKKPTR